MFIQNVDFFELNQAGVYCITCLKNNKKYIGSTNFFLARAARHLFLLKTNQHECLELQTDFNKYKEFFELKVLKNDLKQRLKLENPIYKQIC
jgi:hypothetical protein